MNTAQIIWLASFPRSGNTLLRTILRHCFGFYSGSIYRHEFAGKEQLADYVGHLHRQQNGNIRFPDGNPPFVKTHGHYPNDRNPAIYVVRDGRAASVSLSGFYEDVTLEQIIKGNHTFGTWTEHLQAWRPWERPNTLLLKYEEMTGSLSTVLEKLERFLNCDSIQDSIPDRNTIAAVDGRIVRPKSDWRSAFTDDLTALFLSINGEMMRKLGYLD